MQRLALVAVAGGSSFERVRAAYRPSIGAYFGMGLVGGGAAGAVALLAFQLASGQISPPSVRIPSAIAALGHWVSEPAAPRFGKAAPVVVREPQPDAFDVVIDRGARASAPFGLRLVGTEDTGMEVLLRDVPAAALLSHGERRGLSTWAVKATDLEGLHLTLDDGTPDTFNVRIEVLAPAGVAAASSVARIRLVGLPAERPASAPLEAAPAEPPAAITPVAHVEPAGRNPDRRPPRATMPPGAGKKWRAHRRRRLRRPSSRSTGAPVKLRLNLRRKRRHGIGRRAPAGSVQFHASRIVRSGGNCRR